MISEYFYNNMSLEKYILLLISFGFILLVISHLTNIFFIKFNILDFPNERKIHKKPIPNSGGTILIVSIFLFYIILNSIFKINLYFYTNIIIISLIFYILGLIDDLKSPRTVIKIFLIFIILILSLLQFSELVVSELRFNYIYEQSISLGYLAIPFTIFCVFMFFNALNYSDGKNGICISYSIFLMIFLSLINSDYDNDFFNHFIILSLLIILIYNLSNKLFLGNSGVNFISIFLSLLIIKIYNFDKNILFCDEIFLLMLIPGVDAARVTILRIYKKISPFSPDRNHLHHYLSKFINNNYIWVIYLFLSSLPIIVLYISSNFLIAVFIPIIIYTLLIFKSFNY